jgi:hypothetical protein
MALPNKAHSAYSAPTPWRARKPSPHPLRRPSPRSQDAGGIPFTRSALEAAGGAYSSNMMYGTQYMFFPKGSDGIYKILSEADMLIDETYWVGIPSLANISRSLGFGSVDDAQAAVPAFANGNIFRCGWRRLFEERLGFGFQAPSAAGPRKFQQAGR